MKKVFFGFLALFFVLTNLNASKLDFKDYGFSVDGFSKQKNEKHTDMVVQFYKPAKNGFATNANVIIQEFNGTIEECIELVGAELKSFDKFVLIKHNHNDNSIFWEYTMSYANMNLHMITKVLRSKQKGQIFVLSISALDSQWEEQKKEIQKVVDSFKLN